MKIVCPVCHQEIDLATIKEYRQFVCPHCHFDIELNLFAVQLMQLIPIVVLCVLLLVYTILKIFVKPEMLVLVLMGVFVLGAQFQFSAHVLNYLGLLKFNRKIEENQKLK